MKKPPSLEKLHQKLEHIESLLAYRYVKLTTGEDLVAQVLLKLETPGAQLLRYPMLVVWRDKTEDDSFTLVPWIIFTEQNIVAINPNSIVTMTNVDEDMHAIYNDAVVDMLSEDESDDLDGTDGSPELSDEPGDASDEADETEKPAKKRGPWVN